MSQSITHRVPGQDYEVELRSVYMGSAHGYHWSVRVLRVDPTRRVQIKDDWRQVGSDISFGSDREAARAYANQLWTNPR